MKKEIKKAAKLKALGEMKDRMKKAMKSADDMPMKVTVASDSEEGLKEGLSKAEEIMKAKDLSPMPKEDKKKK